MKYTATHLEHIEQYSQISHRMTMERLTGTYNTVHFDLSKTDILKSRLSNVENSHKLLLEYLIEFLLNAEWSDQMAHGDVYLKLISKIRFLLESCIIQLPLLGDDYRYKVSLALLYRGIVDDLTNLYYLIEFYNPEDVDQRSLESELKILHKEFLRALIEASGADSAFVERAGIKLDEKIILEELEEEIRLANPDLFQEKKFKSNRELRSESSLYLNSNFFQKTAKSVFISEKQKLDFVSEIGRSTDNLKVVFKYFSQLHHFTPKTYDLQNSDIAYDLQCYRMIEIELMYALCTLSKFVVLKDKQRLESFRRDCEEALRFL